jgi:hypothetical protein
VSFPVNNVTCRARQVISSARHATAPAEDRGDAEDPPAGDGGDSEDLSAGESGDAEVEGGKVEDPPAGN